MAARASPKGSATPSPTMVAYASAGRRVRTKPAPIEMAWAARSRKAGGIGVKKRPHFDPEIEWTKNHTAIQERTIRWEALRCAIATARPIAAQTTVRGASFTAAKTA